MDWIEKINTSYKYVINNSKSVKINYSKIDSLINQINSSSVKYWLDSNPYDIMDMDVNDIINFLLIYHTTGDYCFWGNPKWEVETDLGKMDGSFAIMYIILKRFKVNKNFDMTIDEFKELLKGNVTIPLLEDRYQNLVTMNQMLKDNNKSFYDMIKDFNTDSELLSFIINNFPYFKDISIYDNQEIFFYKRAQLLTSDILHVREIKEGIQVDYSHLIGCADYKIPQVMRCYGMLEYSDDLVRIIDSKILLPEGSKEEIEIRANTLEVINYIYEQLNRKYSRMDINDFIWLLGQDKTKMIKPYHRTLTNHY
ncbi:MAG: hypothetical protein IJR82_05155 [Bacilli bacterium]|nr:hypothetical protein [Bacilli bacterium]